MLLLTRVVHGGFLARCDRRRRRRGRWRRLGYGHVSAATMVRAFPDLLANNEVQIKAENQGK